MGKGPLIAVGVRNGAALRGWARLLRRLRRVVRVQRMWATPGHDLRSFKANAVLQRLDSCGHYLVPGL